MVTRFIVMSNKRCSNAANAQDIVHIGSDPDEPFTVESKLVEELSREQLKELKSINRALEEKVLALKATG